MNFKAFSIINFIVLAFLILVKPAYALSDPVSVPNNKFGIHILDPNEISEVPDLVNSSGGDWGYVTVVLRDDDRDLIKWQRFMDTCFTKHLIPIVRLGSTMKPYGWEEPNLYMSLDAANFLDGLAWPTQNRYIVVYNEPNHASEWGGIIDPAAYARVLKYTSMIFKARSENFFILPAGLDAACPNGNGCVSLPVFVNTMVEAEPDIFNLIDGWTTHAYPNPGFSGSPYSNSNQSVISYRFELSLISGFTAKNLPVFITETGWNDGIGREKAAENIKTAFESVWTDPQLVAITPFILNAQGPFAGFSFIGSDGSKKPVYETLKQLAKVSGKPALVPPSILGAQSGNPQNGGSTSPIPQTSPETNLPKQTWHEILGWFKKFDTISQNGIP